MFSSWYGWMTSLFQRLITQLIQGFARFGPGILAIISPIPGMIIGLFTRSGIGQRIIGTIIDGLKARAGALFSWVGGAVSRIGSMIGGGGGGEGSGGGAAATPPGRAVGGSVRAGFPYVVGERRRELFVPGFNGAIIPRIARPITAGAMAALLSAGPGAALAAAPAAQQVAQAPVSLQAPRARRASAPLTINAPVTIHAGGSADAMEISRQVQLAFVDIQREIESAHRVLLND